MKKIKEYFDFNKERKKPNQNKENIPMRKRKIFQLEKGKYSKQKKDIIIIRKYSSQKKEMSPNRKRKIFQ